MASEDLTILKRIGTTLREIRKSRNVGVRDLAAKVGVSHQTIHVAERGGSAVGSLTLVKIARALDFSLAVFDLPQAPLVVESKPKRRK